MKHAPSGPSPLTAGSQLQTGQPQARFLHGRTGFERLLVDLRHPFETVVVPSAYNRRDDAAALDRRELIGVALISPGVTQPGDQAFEKTAVRGKGTRVIRRIVQPPFELPSPQLTTSGRGASKPLSR